MAPGSRTPIGSAQITAKRDAYFATLGPEARRAAKQIRALVREVVPDAVEVFSYGVPGFRFIGMPLVWYAGFKQHVSLYPMGAAIRREHAAALKGYAVSTGTVRFPLEKPLPLPLLKKLVKSRIREVQKPRGSR